MKYFSTLIMCVLLGTPVATAQDKSVVDRKASTEPLDGERATLDATLPTLEEVRAAGALHSSYKNRKTHSVESQTPETDLSAFQTEIVPILKENCFRCHGPEVQEGSFRVDTLDPDLVHGDDADWWLEVAGALTKSEMPPEGEAKMPDEVRGKVIEWLTTEIQIASEVRRSEQGHSSFRRMTRYEYNYTLQDLLGLTFDLAKDLPPETFSQDGFQNSSEMLQMSVLQLEYYRELGRSALEKATVRGARPETLYYGIAMEEGVAQIKALGENGDGGGRRRDSGRNTQFKNLITGDVTPASYAYQNAKYSYRSGTTRPDIPQDLQYALFIPADEQHIFDLGDTLPDTGILRIRALASRTSTEQKSLPALRLEFGFQPSNNSRSTERISSDDVAIQASPGQPQFYQWDIPLGELRRNPYRKSSELGDFPNPTEYLVFQNVTQSSSGDSVADIRIDYLEITTPAYDQWPPESHARIFIDSENKANEEAYARDVLANFMPRAWRRSVTASEIDQHRALFATVRTECGDFQEAMTEVLATVLASPKFLYLEQVNAEKQGAKELSNYELATRLSMFLWCSMPDEELLDLASQGRLRDQGELIRQTHRMLADPRSQRFSEHFVRQWLNLQLLDFLDVEEDLYPDFDNNLREAMQQEPIAFFREVLRKNLSVMDFLHADYALVNERLAGHYGLPEVYGSDFRKVALDSVDCRGGLLTQAGLLAMNSDGKDSHPLKRGIWLLDRILNDPPPPPPPAVPEIDLADPEIAKLTLKERIENHRNHPACMSCHAKIDPWGIALENFDAIGSWRDEIKGTPVDASSLLFNKQKLDGIDGLKRHLLENRQDQFASAIVHKLTTYALGRPLTFSDRASIDEITTHLRDKGDGLKDLIGLIVTSELFLSN